MNHMEKEYKWDASPKDAFSRFLRALKEICARPLHPVSLSITDRYLDNKAGDFSARKIALRIRRMENTFEATLKTRSDIRNGLARRKELTRPLPGARSFPGALKMLTNGPAWEGLSLSGLFVRFMLKNRRRICRVRFYGAECEAAFDSYVICAGGRMLRRKEIELELKKGDEADFLHLVRELTLRSGLEAAKISKVKSAEMMLSGQI